eukprot:XP_011453306.1 PREDICTED: tripartite motif-containing protein 45 [Crassostrea gigas]
MACDCSTTSWVSIPEQCDLCDEPTFCRCSECQIKLCRSCSKEHHSQESTHNIAPYLTDKGEIKSTSVSCRIHFDKMCELFCQDCEAPVCQECITTGHHNYHELKNTQDLLHEKKKTIERDTKEMENVLETELINIRKRLGVLVSTSSSKYEDLEEIVVQHGKKWHDAVEKVIETYVSEIQQMKTGEKDTLRQLTMEIVNLIYNTERSVKFNKEMLKVFEAEKILKYKTKADDIRSKIPEINVPNPSFTEYEVAESKIVHENFGVLKTKVMSIDDDRRNSRELHVVQTFLEHSFPKLMEKMTLLSSIETALSAVYSLSCMENGELWVHGTDNSIMRIDRNHRKLERIKTMSFDGNVGITLKQEGELVYTDFEDRSVNILKKSQTHAVIRLSGWKPRDVCATLEGDLLVSMTSDDEKTAKIVKYRNTKALKEYYHDLRGRPLFPTGDTALHVTENRNWDVCVAVSSAQVVIVLNGLGAVRFKYSDKSGKKEFRPMGIATDGQCHIMVTDYFNSRVHVLDKDGELLRHIEGHGIYLPLSVSVCNYDTIYIGDSTGKIKQIQHLK